MSTLEADDSVRRHIKREIKSERGENGRETPTETSPLDFNRLYGDLYQKLLNTPVQDIFSQSITPGSVNGNKGIPNDSPINMFSPILPKGGPLPPDVPKPTQMNDGMFPHGMTSSMSQGQGEFDPYRYLVSVDNLGQDDLEKIASKHEYIDIPRLVEEFRVSLERFGVSQRFAARFIMQDTSQGNLSFLMEKGKTKSWEELSVRGRIPYIKMKAWLESKDQQLMTLEMIKQSQELKKFSPREPYSRRERFSMYQLQVLCQLFEDNQNPPMNTRSSVAQSLNIPLDRVNVWFQNQRARGFPAKKILQNSMYNEGITVIEKVDTSSTKKGRYSPSENFARGPFAGNETKSPLLVNENNFGPFDGLPMGDPFALLQNFTSSKFGGSPVPIKLEKHQTKTPSKPTSPVAPPSGMSVYKVVKMPSYLPSPTVSSATPDRNITKFPFTYNSPSGQSKPVSDTSQYNQRQLDIARDLEQSSQKHIDSSQDTPPQGGAAKRKRGKRPQQIIRTASPIQPEEWKNGGDELLPQQKRVKLEQSNHDTEFNQKNSSRDINWSIELEASNCNEHGIDLSKTAQSNGNGASTANQNSDTRDVMSMLTNQNTDNALVAIKSVCAHLILSEKENDKAQFEEPDLD